MPLLSLAFLTLPDVPVPDVIRAAGDAGFQGVGLRLLPATPQEQRYPILDDAQALRDARAALADTGVAVVDVEIVRMKPDTDVAAFRPFLERAAELGARHVLVAGYDPDQARLTAAFAKFCELAAPFTEVPDLATARAIVEAAGAPNGGVLVDALHFDRSTTTLGEVRALPRARVNYVQLCDGPAEYDRSPEGLAALARTARLFPGEGAIDLARALPRDAPVSVEVPSRARTRGMTAREIARHAIATARAVLERAAPADVPGT